MDFTAAYRHAGADTVSFSPGSTFIAYVDGENKSNVVVRVSGTLQVVRSWELATPLQALAWSPDGLFLLVSGYGRQGVSFVLPLDPDACVTDGSDDNQGWVARLEGGLAGVDHAQWVPVWRVPSVAQFSRDTGAMLYSLADQSFTALPHTVIHKRMSVMYQATNPVSDNPQPEWFSLVQRERGDYLAIYAPLSHEAPSMESPVEWDLQRVSLTPHTQCIKLHTTHPADFAWSPNGDVVAVWDHELEYRVELYSLSGMHLATFSIDADNDEPSTRIAIGAEEARVVLAERSPHASRARRVPMRASRSDKSWPNTSTSRRVSASASSRVAGGGLGVRRLAWHPSGEFLAVGGYDEHVRILNQQDWTEVYTLDVRRTTLATPQASAVLWRESRRWFEATQGQGIVPLEKQSFPVDPPSFRHDNPLKHGVCWLEWNRDGSFLAVRNEALPTTLFIYTFEGLAERRIDAHLSLSSVIVLATPIHSLSWKPGQYGTLAIVTGKSAVYLFTLQSNGDQSAEAIAIPNGKHSI